MALEIFKLVGSIFVDNSAANDSLAKTDEKASSVGTTLANACSTAAKWGTAIVGATSVAAGAVMGLANDTAATADEIDKASIRMGIDAESYQELAYAAGQCGVEMSVLEKGAKKLEGTGLNMDDAMSQIMAMATAEERAAKAAELFGESVAYQMSPLIEQSTSDYDGLIQRANDLGLIMSGDAVKAGVTLGDTMADIKKSFSMVSASLGNAVIPIVQQFADIIVNNMPMIQEMIGSLAPVLADMVASFLPMVVEFAQNLLPIIFDLISQLLPLFMDITTAVLPVLMNLLMVLIPPLIEIIQVVLPPLISVIQALMPLLSTVISLLTPIISLFIGLVAPILNLIAAAIQPLITIIAGLIDGALKPLMPIIEALSSVLTGTLGVAFNMLKPLIDGIMQSFGGLIDFITGIFTGNWEKAWNGVVDMFDGIFGGIVGMFKEPINFILKGINSVFASLGKIKVPDWVPGIGGSSFSLPQIPLLAKGGNIVGSGQVIVGEEGPELLDLPIGAKVTPLNGSNGVAEIDYDKMTEAFINAITTMLPYLQTEIVAPGAEELFQVVRRQSVVNATLGRPGIVV